MSAPPDARAEQPVDQPAEEITTASSVAFNQETSGQPTAPVKPDAQDTSLAVFSWLEPHAQFVVILVGPQEIPFGIQKDFLCAKSAYYQKYFASEANQSLESVVKLPDVSVEVFGFAQHYMYTGTVLPHNVAMPDYAILLGVWKLGHALEIDGLCDQTLEAMEEVRHATQSIPGAALITQAYEETPEGSSIRELLLEWVVEYIRSSETNANFAKSLPKAVLQSLVMVMSKPEPSSAVNPASGGATAAIQTLPQRKMVHYLDPEDEEEQVPAYILPKKPRRSEPYQNGTVAKSATKKIKTPASAAKPIARRRSHAANGEQQEFTPTQKLGFCHDLLTRMLSGPGFWTRLVGPFKDPVEPVRDNVPDYLEKIPKPMDLNTMKTKLDTNQYKDEQEFLADMNQIFTNCKTYWKPTDAIWAHCEKLEKTFQDKYSQMNKWLSKMEGNEEH